MNAHPGFVTLEYFAYCFSHVKNKFWNNVYQVVCFFTLCLNQDNQALYFESWNQLYQKYKVIINISSPITICQESNAKVFHK